MNQFAIFFRVDIGLCKSDKSGNDLILVCRSKMS